MQILFWIIIMLEILSWFILIDVILSLLQVLFWVRLRPAFISSIIDPMYANIKKYIPTSIWVLDLTPMVAILLVVFIKWALFIMFPELRTQYLIFLA